MFDSLFSLRTISSVTLDSVHFEIKHTRRKNMKRVVMRVEKQNEIRLSTPLRTSNKALKAFINEQKEWILARNSSLLSPFSSGAAFYYLGKALNIEHHDERFRIDDSSVMIDPARAKQQSDRFYKDAAKAYLPTRVEYWKTRMELEFDTLKFRLAKRRWGSCSSKKVITLNPYLMKLSHEMIDYVIVHELAHLKHLNHSKEFYALVQIYLPNYKQTQKQINLLSAKFTD